MRREFWVFCMEPLQPTQGIWLVPLDWNPQKRPKEVLFRGYKKSRIFFKKLLKFYIGPRGPIFGPTVTCHTISETSELVLEDG